MVLFQLLRAKSWVKNVFVLFPLIFSMNLFSADKLMHSLAGVLAFSMFASFIYILNDIQDRYRDSLHPRKKLRPIASGRIGYRLALGIAFIVLSLGIGISAVLPNSFIIWAAVYLFINILYVYWLKHVNILESMVIPVNFILRVGAGCAAISVLPTHWILVITFSISMFLVFIKRRSEVVLLKDNTKEHRPVLKNYNEQTLWAYIIISAVISVFAYILYTIDPVVISTFKTNKLLFTTIFVVIAVFRFLQLANSDEFSGEGDPTELVYKDRFIQVTLVLWMLSVIAIIYSPVFISQ